MSFLQLTDPLWGELASIVDAEGLVLYDVERLGASSLRITIDRDRNRPREEDSAEDADVRGVTSGDCTRVCRRLMIFFTAEGEQFGVSSEPELDVGSPGINRHLRLTEHYQRAIGERVKIVRHSSSAPDAPKPVVIGVLKSVEPSTVVVDDEELHAPVAVDFGSVKRANIEFRF